MAFKPSERFIRALDDAEVRPESMNAQIIGDAAAPAAERLGALIELSASERAKSRAMSQVTPEQSSIAEQVVGSFIQSSPQPAQQGPVRMPMAMAPPDLPGYRHGGLHQEEEDILILLDRLGVGSPESMPSVLSAPGDDVSSSRIMGGLTGVGSPRDVADRFQMDPSVSKRMSDLRNDQRVNYLATAFGSDPTFTREVTYQDPDASKQERILLKRELGIPLTLEESSFVYIPDSRASSVGRGVRSQVLENIPKASERLQDLPSEGLGAFMGAMSETPGVLADVARETPAALGAVVETYPDALAAVPGMDNLSSAMDILASSRRMTAEGLSSGSGDGDTQDRIGEESGREEGGNPLAKVREYGRIEYNYPEGDMFDRVTEGPEGLSDLQQAMLLFSAAQGLSAPIGQGRTTISNLAGSLAKGAGSAAANKIASDRNKALKDFREAQLGSSSRSARARAYNDLKKSARDQVKLEFPDLYTSGSFRVNDKERQALATARYEEIVREGMASLTGSSDDSRILDYTVRVR